MLRVPCAAVHAPPTYLMSVDITDQPGIAPDPGARMVYVVPGSVPVSKLPLTSRLAPAGAAASAPSTSTSAAARSRDWEGVMRTSAGGNRPGAWAAPPV